MTIKQKLDAIKEIITTGNSNVEKQNRIYKKLGLFIGKDPYTDRILIDNEKFNHKWMIEAISKIVL